MPLQRSEKLSQHIAFLKDFFRSYKDFSDAQIDTIEILLTKLYARFGITDATDYGKKLPTDFPIMQDFYKLCEEEFMTYDKSKKYLYTEETLQEVCLGINSMCVGAESRYFNGHTNITDNDMLATVMGNVIDNKPFDNDFGIIHCSEGIDLMPCNVELSGIESYLFTVMSCECIMRTYINQVKKNYDYILIDCTPSLGLLPINAFVAADSIIVPSQPRILSTKGLDLLLRTYSQVKRGINPDLKIDGILFTMVDSRTVNDRSVIEAMRESFGMKINVFDTFIPASVRVTEANTEGKSIFAYP